MSPRCSLLAALSFLALPALARAQGRPDVPTRPVTQSTAVRASGVIRIDGHLDESAWAQAPVTESFTQIDPEEGKPASQRTEVKVLYDDDYLYVGVRLHDTGPVTGRLGRRDMDLGDSDWFGVMIDSYHDHRTAFGFDVNPVGVRRDEVKIIDEDDNSWAPVWDVASSVDGEGWTAEYRIPFSQLRFSGAREQTWGLQFERIIGRRNEYAVSTFIPKSERGGVPGYGHLSGLRDLKAGKRIELLPYVVQRASYVDPGPNPFKNNPDHNTSGGLDLVYRLSSNLTVNAAFNPDFGQVEVDPAVVNLGVYETFFEEKRPFFIEGSEIFDFGAAGTSGGQLFYSRRIGRAPTLFAPTPESDRPDATTILGAAKVSGKVGGWSLGMLEAVTDREVSRFRDVNVDDEMTIEPLANYFVGRARREVRGGETFVGGVFTSTLRKLDEPALKNALHSAAYATGIDFRHEWGKRTWVVFGDGEVSRVEGSTSAIIATQRRSNHFFQRPDATHLEVDSAATSLNGYSVNVSVGKQQGLHWRGAVAAAITSPQYEVNDLGFAVRTDRRDAQATLTYVENKPGPLFRRWSLTEITRSEHNFDWQPILTFSGVQAFAQTPSYWTIHANAQRFFTAMDDRLTRGGPIATRPAWWSYGVNIQSDVRKPVTANINAGSENYDFGGWDWNVSTGIGIKSSTRWNLTMGPSIFRLYTPAQFAGSIPDPTYTPTYGNRYIFAPLHQTSVGLETRFNVTFTPRLTLETYVQPLLSSAEFGAPKQLVAPQTFAFVPYTQSQVPDFSFNLRSLRGNAVLRWEWRAGSTMYFAWQQSRSNEAPYGDFSFARDRNALFRTRPDNIFLVKVNYWINP
jgi:hypothetical protein